MSLPSDPTIASRLLRIREIADAFGIQHPQINVATPPTVLGPATWMVQWTRIEYVAHFPIATIPLGASGLTLEEAMDDFLTLLEEVLAAWRKARA